VRADLSQERPYAPTGATRIDDDDDDDGLIKKFGFAAYLILYE